MAQSPELAAEPTDNTITPRQQQVGDAVGPSVLGSMNLEFQQRYVSDSALIEPTVTRVTRYQ